MSRVIRGGGDGPRGVVPREVYDAREEARRIVDEAREQAASIVEDAERNAESIRERARAEGHEAGRAEAAALLARAAALRDQASADAERDTARVALAAAERIVGEELAVSPDRIAAIVGEALGRARRANEVVVSVCPADAETLRAMQAEVAAHAGNPARFSIREDPELTRGGCIVRTELGEIDARVEVQLESLARALGLSPLGS